MRQHLFIFIGLMLWLGVSPQKLTIVTLHGKSVEVHVISDSTRQRLLRDLKGRKDNTIRKPSTARSFRLSDGRLLIEFYDRQAAVIAGEVDFEKLREIRFTKNYIDFLKKNVSYKIEIPYEQGVEMTRSAKRKEDLKSDQEGHAFQVYEMKTGQILFLIKSKRDCSATIYENMKGLCSDHIDILDQYYQGMDEWSAKLLKGDPLFDYETDGHLVWVKSFPRLKKNHQLILVESLVYVNDFYGNLYRSAKGYYVLIDEASQKTGSGKKMTIVTVRVYESLAAVRAAQAAYEGSKINTPTSEHFFQKISERYGAAFPSFTRQLIDSLPTFLNFDKDQLGFDSAGMALVDEAIHWNHANHRLFDQWFPAVLAYYGQCYLINKKEGQWVMKKEKKDEIWIPHFLLANGEEAFDVYAFYKDLWEWPQSMKWAGDWSGSRKESKKRF